MQLHRAREEFDAAGARLVFIGQATLRHARHFRDRLGLEPLPILADEERRSYRVAGFERGSVTQLLGPRSVLAGVKPIGISRPAKVRNSSAAFSTPSMARPTSTRASLSGFPPSRAIC